MAKTKGERKSVEQHSGSGSLLENEELVETKQLPSERAVRQGGEQNQQGKEFQRAACKHVDFWFV